MRNGIASSGARSWMRRLAWIAVVLGAQALASTTPPHEYHVLSPEPLSGAVSVMSLEPNNTITVGTEQVTLQQYQRATIPAAAFTSGSKFSGTGFFTVGSNENAADLLVPDDFAGTTFVVPHIAGSHKYFLLSPSGAAHVTVQLGANTYNLTANQGIVNEFDAGGDNGIAGRITSDVPILVTHAAYLSASARDAYPVPPAANEVLGVRSQNTIVAALSDGTSVTVYSSNGASGSYSLNAGEQVTVTTGVSGTQGQGNALRVVANAPIAAVQYDDGDGNDATAFWSVASFGRRHAVPIDAQYLAVVCEQLNVTVTLYKGANPPETQICSGSSTTPGKAYFGSSTSGVNLAAGWYAISSSPVYVMYEATTPEDEHNLLGLTPLAGPTPPVLNAISSPTSSNPQAVAGSAGAGQTVRLYVNGLLQSTATADGSGNFALTAALVDGINTLYTTAVVSGNESDPSNAVSVEYVNSIPRSQSGTISGSVVWTPGNPATPYTITASLTVAAGAKLTLQPGTTLRFANSTVLTVNGELKIAGTPSQPVLLTSNAASPARGSWSGVLINTAGTTIEYATIEYTLTAVNVAGVAATVRNNTLRLFTNNGVYVSTGAGAASTVIRNNFIDNTNDTGDCIETNNSSPQIAGNTLTNCDRGVHVVGAAAPTVTGNNVITGNNYGIYANGSSGVATLPVVTGNQIFTNDNANYIAAAYGATGANLKLNATGNWWGATDPTAIAGTISDLTDSNTSTLPSVDYSNFLNGPNGSAVPGNYLLGKLLTSTTLTGGTTYDVLGAIIVSSGVTLTIPAGTTLRFHSTSILAVDGVLAIQGTSSSLVTLTSGRATPARDNWPGLLIRANGSTIEYARIEYTTTAINIAGVTTSVRNNTLRFFLNNGVYISAGAGGAATTIQANLIDNLNDTGDCIEIAGVSPQVIGNTLTNCARGIFVNGTATPAINGNNVITGNTNGVYLSTGTPQPVVTGNQIFGNTTNNFYADVFTAGAQSLVINATGNWWGTTDPTTIAAGILDLTDDYAATDRPTVSYANFLNGPGGAPVAGNYLQGRVAASGSLLANTVYDVLGVYIVNSGATLTIPAGTTLRFHANATFVVDGVVNIQGTSTSPVTLTSGRATPARDNWPGVLVRANGSLIEYARIEYTTTAINIAGVTATVRNNTLRYFLNNGVYISAGAGAAATIIQGNSIDNLNDTGDCIEIAAASPQVIGNTLVNCSRALFINGAAAPVVNGNNVLTSNANGVYLSTGSPQPVITGNQIFGNTSTNFFADAMATGAQNLIIDATGNWWGTTDLTAIGATITDLSDAYTVTDRPTVNYSGPLVGPLGAALPGNYLIGPQSATSTTLTAGATYEVIGVVFVGTGKSLTIPAGATLRFHGALTRLVIDGTLSIQGVSGNPVTLTTGRTPAARGHWSGVLFRNGSTTSVIEQASIEWAVRGVELVAGAAATVRNSTIRNFSDTGIYLTSSTAATLINGNVIDNLNDTGMCLFLSTASPVIQGNTLRNCQYGLRLSGNSTAAVNGNNIIHSNLYGIYASSGTPLPVVTGNQIFANTTNNFFADTYTAGAQNLVLNATGNWWGTTDETAISASILDLTDAYTATDRPTVDFSGLLDGPAGAPVLGQQLIGPLPATSTTLTAGATYDVIGVVFVGAGKSLNIPAGTVLRFNDVNARLVVDGTLSIAGSSASPVILTSGRTTQARGDWPGVLIRNGSTTSLIDYAQIEWAVRGVELVAGATATVRNSVIRNFSDTGIYLTSSTSATLISSNVIDNLNDAGTCLFLSTASPTIQGNILRNCQYGLRLSGNSTAVVNSNNIINSNLYGVYATTGTPLPVVTGNQIYANTTNNFFADTFTAGAQNQVLNATGNWWGTIDATAIANSILDLTDAYTATDRPTVDFSGRLDGPGGAPVPGLQLIGPLSATSTTLTAGATYDVLGVVFVGSGKSLTIPAGVTLRYHSTPSRLVVDGSLSVQGTEAARVKFTSGLADPAKGAWQGIEVRATATTVAIDYAIIEWAVRALSVTNTNASISNSILRSFSDTGVWMSGVSASSQIANNYIDNLDSTGNGIYLLASSPAITNNQIYRTAVGIYAEGASNPVITGNAISNNARGIVLDGNNSNSATAVPNPVITGNDIFGNAGAQIEIFDYGTTNPVVINAMDNWWGTATPVVGQQIRFTSGSPTTSLNHSNPANAPRTRPVSGNIAVSSLYFSPNADGVQDVTTISGSLNQSSNWTVTIRNSGSSVVRTFTGSGTSISASWNGQDGGGQLLADGVYTVEVTATAATGTNMVGSRVTTLDNTPPVTAITSPTASTSFSNVLSVPVSGTATDGYLVNYTLQYGVGTTPTTWTNLASQSGGTGVTNALLATWIIGSSNGAAGLGNGPYVLRLASSDKAGNTGLVLVPVTIDLLSITGVSQNVQQMRPLAGEQLQVNFTLGAPAVAKLQIYPEAGGSLVREISQTFSSGGVKSMTWDGRNSAGVFVADEAYSYAILANDGTRIAAYDPPPPGTIGSGSGTVDATYNANENDFWKMNYTMNHYGRVRMQVGGCTTPTHFPYNWVPFPPGVHPLIWDGRDASGRLVTGSCDIYFDAPLMMKSNMVIVRGAKPLVSGAGASPNIEVKSNPFRIAHSYEQISRISYRVDQDSYVTVKLLPPGVSDPSSPQAIVLTDTVLQPASSGGAPADYQVEWRGYEELDSNDILVSDEGSYTFAITATSAVSGATTVYRGVLQLWQ